jgi:hypothetical protein
MHVFFLIPFQIDQKPLDSYVANQIRPDNTPPNVHCHLYRVL